METIETNSNDQLEACRRLQPGEFFSHDYRGEDELKRVNRLKEMFLQAKQSLRDGTPFNIQPQKNLKVMTWNIERGIKLAEIIAEIRRQDPDIICLQEIDSGCDRSFNVDTGTCVVFPHVSKDNNCGFDSMSAQHHNIMYIVIES